MEGLAELNGNYNNSLSSSEELRVLNAIRQYRPYLLPFTEYCLEVPCRKSELVKAKREQYNPFTGTIYIPDSKADISIYKPVPESLKSYFNSIPSDCPYLFFKQSKNGKHHPLSDFKKSMGLLLEESWNIRLHYYKLGVDGSNREEYSFFDHQVRTEVVQSVKQRNSLKNGEFSNKKRDFDFSKPLSFYGWSGGT